MSGVRTITRVIRKSPLEILKKIIDFSDDLGTGEFIDQYFSGSTTITPAGVTVPTVSFTGTDAKAEVTVDGGTSLITYHVKILMGTTGGQKLAAALIIPVRDG
jgi:hypothetical protein